MHYFSSQLLTVFTVVVLLVGSAKASVFDDFSENTISGNRWSSQDAIRQVKNGKLHLGIRKHTDQTGTYRTGAMFQNPNVISKIQASVQVESYNFDTGIHTGQQIVSTEIYGTFYEDSNGSVGAGIGLVDFGGPDGLQAGCFINTQVEGQGSDQLFTSVPVSAGKPYTMTVGYNAGVFTCVLKDETTNQSETINLTAPTTSVGDPSNAFKVLVSAYEIQGLTDDSFMADASIISTFDNVEINGLGVVYDDFSSPMDATKWISQEFARVVDNGRLELTQQNNGSSSRMTNRIRTADSVDGGDFFQVDITIDGSSQLNGNENTFGQAIAGGYFYNDTYDSSYNGLEGDNYARIHLQLKSSGIIEAIALIWRCDNADCATDTIVWNQSFTTAPPKDVPQTVSIERNGSAIKFKLNDEVIDYPITGNAFAPSRTQRRLTTRAYSTTGENSYITAYFDNVYFEKDSTTTAWNLFLPAILSSKKNQ